LIYEVSLAVEKKLRALGYPVDSHYGPAPGVTAEGYPHGLLVFDRPTDASDQLAPAMGTRNQNPLYRGVRAVAATVLIYAKAEQLEGARIQDHQDACEDLIDQVLIALDEWCSENKRGAAPALSEMRYMSAEERGSEETWPGVVYRIRFSVNRAVVKLTSTGDARPVGRAAGVANRTDVRYTGHKDPPVTGCETTE
jgi:hypothetical protein